MADTVKSRATRYAMDIARRKFDTQDQKYLRKQAKVTPSLLALARINLAREALAKSLPVDCDKHGNVKRIHTPEVKS